MMTKHPLDAALAERLKKIWSDGATVPDGYVVVSDWGWDAVAAEVLRLVKEATKEDE